MIDESLEAIDSVLLLFLLVTRLAMSVLLIFFAKTCQKMSFGKKNRCRLLVPQDNIVFQYQIQGNWFFSIFLLFWNEISPSRYIIENRSDRERGHSAKKWPNTLFKRNHVLARVCDVFVSTSIPCPHRYTSRSKNYSRNGEKKENKSNSFSFRV